MIRSIYNKFFQKLQFSLLGFIPLLPTISNASENIGVPKDYQLTFQDAATPNMADITWFHNSFLFPIILVITLFVTALLIYVMIRFSAKNNPNPSKTTHNSLVEVIWTVVPVIILIVIAIPSFRILYTQQDVPIDADLTIKATGYQWYWGYEYPDNDGMYFDSLPLEEDELTEGKLRLLSVDNPLVVPAGAVVRVQVTSSDVIHNWAVPSFGVKMDAIPGRLNETWFKVDNPGIYYGMCSELCGVRHAFMPIEVHVMEEADYQAWLVSASEQFASKMKDSNNIELVKLIK
ncbi:MAG: cytochrome c oxidase subunit II [Rhizobiales bacterium]|jgi:cytochrome c oxidase subunit 2|nr:cytochrome c oxidase subunit II [Hyphomicrobiales bacterium]MBL6771032.1 cytochrome c oxidase subunit II [Hyphomicrobiales bacterium]